MKKFILITSIVCASCYQLRAQSTTINVVNSKFISAMETNLRILDTAGSASSFTMLANNFERIAAVEKNQWEPFYYAAYCYALMASTTPDKTKIDILANTAEQNLNQADLLQKNNSEISALFAMIKSAKLLVDPTNRWMSLGQEITHHISEAKGQDSSNPRPYLVESRIKYRLPQGLGGGKEAAKALLVDAITKFKNFKPSSSIAPVWGLNQAESFLEKLE